MEYTEFNFTLAPGKIDDLEKFLGDCIESLWWDQEGNVTGILIKEKYPLFHKRFIDFFSTSGNEKPSLHTAPLEGRDWLEEDQKKLRPIEVGAFFIYPPHFSGVIPSGKIPFKIDSPHSFGSGHHETTSTCLKVLQDLASTTLIKKAVDVGCGSGILAMAITFLWDIPVYATDCDPKSIREALKNIQDSSLTTIKVVECDGLEHPEVVYNGPYDLVVANIHSEPLKKLSPSICKVLSSIGKVLVSGILHEQESDVIQAYTSQKMKLSQVFREGQWSTLLFDVDSSSSKGINL